MNLSDPYVYKLRVTRVVDGDTVDGDIDLGFNVELKGRRIRLWGINAPETRTKDKEEKSKGQQAKDWLEQQIWVRDNEIYVHTRMDSTGKFGRILGVLYPTLDGSMSYNEWMVKIGLAIPYMDDGLYGEIKHEHSETA